MTFYPLFNALISHVMAGPVVAIHFWLLSCLHLDILHGFWSGQRLGQLLLHPIFFNCILSPKQSHPSGGPASYPSVFGLAATVGLDSLVLAALREAQQGVINSPK